MESFRTEYEHEVATGKLLVDKDIRELGDKIAAFKEGKIPEDQFRSLRLARGVYGQRQPGVQMIRIKLPYGKVTSGQLRRNGTEPRRKKGEDRDQKATRSKTATQQTRPGANQEIPSKTRCRNK